MIEEVSGTGMLWPLLIIFLHMCHFYKKMHKNENRLCPLPYEEVLEDSLDRTMWESQRNKIRDTALAHQCWLEH